MQVGDFIQEFREAVDDCLEPHFWPDEVIVRYLNEAVQEACERALLIEDRTTPAVCSLPVVANQATYNLHPSVLRIKRATLNGGLIDETSVEELDEESSRWETRQGTPRRFIFEPAAGSAVPRLRLVSIPTAAGTVGLTVYRGALKPLAAERPTDVPEIPVRFHLRLLDWMFHRAYLKQDADTFDPNKAAVSLTLFEQEFGARPDANVQRKQADRQPPIVRCVW